MRLLLIKIFLMLITNVSLTYNLVWAQDCELVFEYRVEKKSNSDLSKIYITLNEGSPELSYQLIDLNQAKIIQTKTLNAIKGKEILIFDNISPSTYVINVTPKDCKYPYSIGGFKGIEVD